MRNRERHLDSAASNRQQITTATVDTVRSLGIVRADDPSLHRPAQRFSLPGEAGEAIVAVLQLRAVADRITDPYTFSKGMGLAAPQIGIDRAAAIVRPRSGPELVLLNPRIIEATVEETEHYEGCLSFFEVRGLVPRPKVIDVEHQDSDGQTRVTRFRSTLARLVAHEVDHLHGILYTARMRPGSEPVPLDQVPDTGQPWPEG